MENKVRYYREKKGWTQKELAEISGVPNTTISAVETERRVPGVDIGILIARALGEKVETLFIMP